MGTSSRQKGAAVGHGYCALGQVFSQRVPPSGVKQEKPSSFARAFNMSSAGPRFIREIVVVRPIVSAPGSAQMHVRVPSEPTPEGPKAASLSGVSPSSARTASDRIARQSVGSATGRADRRGARRRRAGLLGVGRLAPCRARRSARAARLRGAGGQCDEEEECRSDAGESGLHGHTVLRIGVGMAEDRGVAVGSPCRDSVGG